jgi:HD superfamily phosphohydrolase YqeK
VAETIGRLTREWGADSCAAALRAAWFHDAWRSDGVKETAAAIRAAGEEPDAWASLHAPVLLHAQAAAAWARSEMAETDSQVLLAVRHHSTGHPAWEDVGRALYVADFCEPTRPFAASLQTDGLVVRAAADPASLAAVALEILMLRLAGALRQKRPIHPDSWCTWNAWVGGATDA